jgi:GAF domain-containing protein
MAEDRLLAAAATAALGAEERHRALLQAIVDCARGIFGAEAASVFLHDATARELVFEAVAGRGERRLVGRRFPDGTGIAGWVLSTQEPLALDDVTRDGRFDQQAASSTGYVPERLLAVPLLADGRAVGVLNVLDPGPGATGLEGLRVAGLFADQAAIALDLLQRARAARAVLGGDDSAAARVAQLVDLLETADAGVRAPADDAVDALVRLLAARR